MQSCIICLEEGTNLKQLNHCGLYYVHKNCYKKWGAVNNTCIVCREPIIKEHIILVHPQEIQERQERQERQEIQHYYNYRIINTIQFRLIYTIIVIIITLTTAFIFFIW